MKFNAILNVLLLTLCPPSLRLRRDSLQRLLCIRFSVLPLLPADCGMACQAVKKAISKTDGLLKAGGGCKEN